MKIMRNLIAIAAAFGCLLPANLHAATLCVWPGSPTPGSPYDSWGNAAHDIQTAVNAASPGDTVLVTNGVYATGGAVTPGYTLPNRVVITKAITLQSVNGPDATIIQGQGPLGAGAMRCVYMTNGATLIGFTLTNGFTLISGDSIYDRRGGGALMEQGGQISNCVIVANSAHNMGGGVFGLGGGNLFNSLVQSNQAVAYAGGVYFYLSNSTAQSVVQDCQIVGNWAGSIGGMRFVNNGLIINCLIRGNWATNRAGGISLENAGTLVGCTIASNTVTAGNGGGASISGVASVRDSHFWGNSAPNPASGYGGGVAGSGSAPPMLVTNCDFLWNQANAGAAAAFCQLANCDVRTNQGTYAAVCYCTAVGTALSYNTGTFGGAANNSFLTNCSILNNVGADGGGVDVTALDTCTVIGNHATYHGGGAAYSSVYNSLIASNSSVLAGGGIYNSASSNYLVSTSQVIGNQAGGDGGGLHLDSGASVLNSLILGNQSLNYGGGVSVSNKGLVANCQIVGNAANSGSNGWNYGAAYSGGGVWCADASGVITNCVVSGCVAGLRGGGVYLGTVFNSQIISNSAYNDTGVQNLGGGTYGSMVYDCTLRGNYSDDHGGGANGGTLHRCTFRENSARWLGGGASGCVGYDSLFVGNSAVNGGAAYGCTLYGDTLIGNSAIYYGGASGGTLFNSIVYGNSGGDVAADAYFSCAPGLAAGVNGNITNAPVFANPAAGDYSLNFLSPCINAGTNFAWMTTVTDLGGNPRILGGQTDLGAFEFNALQATGAVSVVLNADYTNAATGGRINFAAVVSGRATGCLWQWDDGTSASNLFNASHAFSTLGTRAAVFTVWNLDTTNLVQFTIDVIPPSTHYVSLTGTHIPPFTNWPSAATNIQAAIDASIPGDSVLVTSGVYSQGGAFAAGVSNRIALNKSPLYVTSVNGPAQTVILGDSSGVRGAFLGSGTFLAGFTITNGFASVGGGAWCDASGTVSNCTLVGNRAGKGGGVYGGTLWRCTISQNTVLADVEAGSGLGGGALEAVLYDCLVVANSAYGWEANPGFGGGVSGGRLFNCTVTGNHVGASNPWDVDYGIGSGTYGSLLANCIVYGSTGSDNNVEGGSASYTCMPSLSVPGDGNLTNSPAFVNLAAGDYRLTGFSPCIGAGTNQDWMLGATDLAGNPRVLDGRVDLGAFEYDVRQATGAITGTLNIGQLHLSSGTTFDFSASLGALVLGCAWQWGDGTTTPNAFNVSHSFSSPGTYTVVFTAWNLTATNSWRGTVFVTAPSAALYVSLSGTHIFPFTDPAGAATNIQAAVDAAVPGDLVLVAGGTYSNGAVRLTDEDQVLNQVYLNKPITLRSLGGPNQTIISAVLGQADGGRGVRIDGPGLLDGFTITGGNLLALGGTGAGVWSDGQGVISNCVVTGNIAASGAGVQGGTLWRCTIRQNEADTHGSGVSGATLYNCLVVSNVSYRGHLLGGAADDCTLWNCTVAGNTGGGVYNSDLWNCIAVDNTGGNTGVYDVEDIYAQFTCASDLPLSDLGSDYGNITNAPLFVNEAAGDFRLVAGSPCINAGMNQDWMIGALDLASLPRIASGTVDMGAYEFQSTGPTTITASLLLSPLCLHLEWPSSTGTRYQLQSATNLPPGSWTDEGAPFLGTGGVLQTNLPITTGPVKFFRLLLNK